MSTTIGTTKAALLTRFNADADLITTTGGPRIQVSRGSILPTKPEGEYIEIGNVTDIGEVHAGLGTDGKQENYAIEIIISVVRSVAELYSTLEDRALVIYGHIWDSIIDWRTEATPFNGIAGYMEIAGKKIEEFFSSDGNERECRITIVLEVTARI